MVGCSFPGMKNVHETLEALEREELDIPQDYQEIKYDLILSSRLVRTLGGMLLPVVFGSEVL